MLVKNFIKLRRSQVGISQYELADILTELNQPTSHARVSHWESGRNSPPLQDQSFRRALARALQMSEDDLMKEVGWVSSVEERSSEAKIAAEIVDRLPSDIRKIAVQQLRALEEGLAKA